MSHRRPSTGDLVWIEYQGRRQRAVYLAYSDTFLLGDGTHVPSSNVAEWSEDVAPDGVASRAEATD